MLKNDEETRLFRNHYRCDDCGHEWSDIWSCTSNDRCPTCRKEFEPCESEDVEE